MRKIFLQKLFSWLSIASLLLQTLTPFTTLIPQAYAQEVTPTAAVSPTPTDTVTPTDTTTPTPTDTITPTVSPTDTTTPTVSPTDAITPTDTTAPTPTDIATPTPDTTTNQPSSNPSPTNNSQAPPTSTPTVTPTITPAPTQDDNGQINASILSNASAASLDLSSTQTNSATLTTDKADYSPTSIAIITGNGFVANKPYTLEITSSDAPAVDFTTTVTTDKNGSFTYAYQLDGNYRPNYTVYVKEGEHTVATTTFTDSFTSSIDLYSQCANGTGSGPTCAWTNGDLNNSNSKYYEGDATVQRLAIEDLTSGDHTVTIQYDTTKNGKHAYDYITDDKFSENWVTNSDLCSTPLSNFTSCSSSTPVQSNLIPTDPNAAGHDITQSARHFTIRNGTWVSGGIASGPTLVSGGSYAGDSSTNIQLQFHVDATTCSNKYQVQNTDVCEVLITFGAHISTQLDWGAGNSAVNISGSPYHVRVIELDGSSIGKRDNQMAASAVPPAPGLSTQVSPTTIYLGQSVTDTATYTETANTCGTHGNQNCPVSGTTQFYVCGPTGSATPCTSTSTPVGSPVINASDKATSPSFTPTQTGVYCFAAYYTPDSSSAYSPTFSTVTTNECVTVSNPPTGTLTVNKVLSPSYDTGLFNLQIDGQTAGTGANVGNNGTTGAVVVSAGSHTVSETAGTSTDLSNYTAKYSGDCDANGNVTVSAGQNAVCTITNTRNTADLKVKKVVDDGSPLSDWGFSLDNGNTVYADPTTGIADLGQVTTNVNHTITESGANQSEYTLVSVTGTDCTPNNDGKSATANIPNGTSGIICTFTNDRDTGTIQVKKVVSPSDNGATSWNFTISGPTNNTANGLHDGDSSSALTSYTGNYTITESGTDLSNYTTKYSCTDGINTLVSGLDITTSTFTLLTGKNVVCTFTNTRNTGTITVNKVIDPSTDSGKFNLQVDGTTQAANVGNGGTTGAITVDTGTHAVFETAGKNTNLSDYTSAYACTLNGVASVSGSGTTISGLTVNANDTVVCTFTNTLKRGTIIVKKTMVGGTGSFNFTGDVAGTISTDGGTLETDNVIPGTYTSVEGAATGWDLTNISCDDTDSTGDVKTATATFKVNPGETVTCTFTNTKRGAVVVTKYLDDNANGTQDNGELGIPDWTINLSSNSAQLTDATGVATFSAVLPATYTLSETMPDNTWTQSNITCDNGTYDSKSGTYSLTVSAGATVNCSIGNYQNATITVVKKVIDPDGHDVTNDNTSFPFTIDQLNQNFDLSNGQVATFSAKPGNYDVTEIGDPNYTLVDCQGVYNGSQAIGNFNGQTATENVTLGSGDSVTVTCVNQQKKAEVIGAKWNDENGDGVYDWFGCLFPFNTPGFTCEPGLSGWTIFADTNNNQQLDPGEVSTVTGPNGNYTLDLNPGTYNICEVMQSGWKQTYPSTNGVAACHQITISSNEQYDGELNFGNHLIIPILTLTKTNDKLEQDLHAGDSVLYTLTITATQSAAQNVTLTDLLPNGFHYRNGSATIDYGNGEGPQTFTSFTDDYHSPGIWNIGNMSLNQTITLTLIADIDNSEQPGNYKDVAYAKGQALDGTTVLANGNNSWYVNGSFVGTYVNVVADQQNSVGYQAYHDVQQSVLGAATSILPDTGANTLWVYLALILLTIGAGSIIIGFFARKGYIHA